MKTMIATMLTATVVLASHSAAQTRFAELARLDHLPAQHQVAPIVELVDLDGDKHLDLVTSHRDGLSVMRGSSSGVFVDSSTLHSAAGSRTGFAVGDVDGDGDVDIVYFAWTGQDSGAKLLLNDGKAGLRLATVGLPSLDRVTSLAFGDVDGDRDLDLFVGRGNGLSSGTGVSNILLLGDGLGRFVAASNWPADQDNTLAAVFVDVDHDGDLDLIAANSAVYLGPGPQNTLYLGDGKGGFSFAPTGSLPADTLSESGIATGDVNNDGYVDFVVANGSATPSTSRAAHLFLGNGKGQFSETPIGAAIGLGTDVALLDVDKDGDLDLFVTRGGGGSAGVQLYVGDGKGGFTSGGTGFEDEIARSVSLATGDVDGNGVVDFVVGNYGDRTRLYLGLGGLRWLDAIQPFRIGSVSNSVTQWNGFALHDFDGDGNLDLIEAGGAPLRLSLGNAKSDYTDVTSTHVPNVTGRVKGVWVADCDRDGDLDLFVHLEDSATWSLSLRLLINSGSAKFQLAPASSIPFTNSVTDLSIDDLDADGHVDLVVDGFGRLPAVYRGNSKHVFTIDSRSSFDASKILQLHRVADVDRDGDLDIVYRTGGYLSTDVFQVYANDGTGAFQLLSSVKLANAISVTEFHVCDVDGDQVPDLATADYRPMLLIGDGKGGFVDETAKRFPLPVNVLQKHRFADYDQDGDLDVIVAVHPGALRYYRNTGGSFRDTSSTEFGVPVLYLPPLVEIQSLDFDGDRDADFVFGSERGISVLFNLYRHTREPYVLGLGRPFVISVSSHHPATTQIALVLVAAGAANLTIEPYGRLRLDLGTHILSPPLLIPASGHLEVALPMPTNSSLVGLELHTQSLLVTGPLSASRLTNLAVSNPLIR